MVNQEMMQSLGGCVYLKYRDAIEEVDGTRVLRCWQYMLPDAIIGTTGHENHTLPRVFTGHQERTYVPDTTTSVVLYQTFNPASSQSDCGKRCVWCVTYLFWQEPV